MSRVIKSGTPVDTEEPSQCTLITVDFKARKVLARIRLGEL